MQTQVSDVSAGVPPIVLVVENDADTCELYETALGLAGLWVAKATAADDALDYALELRPDAVVMDVTIPSEDDGLALATALRANSRVDQTPIVAVTGLAPQKIEAHVGLFTAVFFKPVRLERLVRRVKWLSVKAVILHERSERARARVPGLVAQSNELLARSARIGNHVQSMLSAPPLEATDIVRTCPRCRNPLRFTERRMLEGTTFDYYRPCKSGCGLYCYDHSRRKMITLVG